MHCARRRVKTSRCPSTLPQLVRKYFTSRPDGLRGGKTKKKAQHTAAHNQKEQSGFIFTSLCRCWPTRLFYAAPADRCAGAVVSSVRALKGRENCQHGAKARIQTNPKRKEQRPHRLVLVVPNMQPRPSRPRSRHEKRRKRGSPRKHRRAQVAPPPASMA